MPTSREDSRSYDLSSQLAAHRKKRAVLDTFMLWLYMMHGAGVFTHAISESNLIMMCYGHHFPGLLRISILRS